ncbi:DUF4114 domain-containing protein [Leptolyngbya sp. AN02str]|uniref:DUF4114 domain-containing protein n=1 Tax=Leptolyngbya sp. AN02str TaxID=3423363 RepID=UPI003D3158C7
MNDTSFAGDLGGFSVQSHPLVTNEFLHGQPAVGDTIWQKADLVIHHSYASEGEGLWNRSENGLFGGALGGAIAPTLPTLPTSDRLIGQVTPSFPNDGLLSSIQPANLVTAQPWLSAPMRPTGTSHTLPVELAPAWQQVQTQLQQFLANPGFERAIATAFGSTLQPQQARQVIAQWIAGDALPNLEIVPAQALKAKGAFSASNYTIYLSQEWMAQSTTGAIAAVVLEELGHALDSQLNTIDASGDEGAIFAALVQGEAIAAVTLHTLKTEHDHATFTWQNQTFAVEQAALGEFTVGATGQVSIDYVFDGGSYQGQIAIFSLGGMQNLVPGSPEFIKEAARRALTNSTQGYVVISDGSEGAKLSGDLGERNFNRGSYAGPKTVAMTAGDTFGIMLVPDGTVQSVFDQPSADGKQRPLFSLDAANPNSATQFAQVANNLFAMEDLRRDRTSDNDFNDVMFKIEGATAQAAAVATLVPADQTWSNKPLMQSILAVANDTPLPTDPDSGTPPVNPPVDPPVNPPVNPGTPTNVLTSFTDTVVKFGTGENEGAIAALNGSRITIGTKTLYIGTQQVSSINQNPIIRLFDSANPQANWTRTDYEITGADGRGYGLVWTGTDLYAVFSVDGTQGSSSEDFRRASQSAQQAWLRSYGQGGGPKVSVIGRIDLNTGELLDAAYLSALLSNGNSNSLVVKNLSVNTAGNLVISADSFFAPRNPDGSRMQQVNTSLSSPFAYTIELQPDLKRVISTQAVGWA